MPNSGPDLVVRVAANISAMQADMSSAAQSIKGVEEAARKATDTASWFVDTLGKVGAAIGIGFSVREIIGFVEEIISSAAELEHLALKSDMSVESLQLLRIVGGDVGVSLDTIVTAADRLQQRIAGGSESVVSAIGDLNLNFATFRALSPDDKMMAVAEAVAQLHDPLRVADDLFRIYGRGWQEMVPVLKELASGHADDVKRMSAGEVTALHDAEVAMSHWWENFKNTIGAAAAEKIAGPLEVATLDVRAFAAEVGKKIPDPGWGALIPPGLPDDIKQLDDDWNQQKLDLIEAAKEGAHALEEWDNWLQELSREHTDTFKLAMEHERQFRDEQYQLTQRTNAAIAAEFDAQQQLNEARGLETRIYGNLDPAMAKYLKALDELHTRKVEGISQLEQELVLWNQYVEDLNGAASAEEALASAAATTYAVIGAGIPAIQDTADRFAKLSVSIQASQGEMEKFYATLSIHSAVGTPGAGGVGMATGSGAGNLAAVAASAAGALSRDVGGPVSAGQPYYIGTGAQPELFIPSTSGTMVPNGAGASIVAHIYVTQPLGTPQAIAAAVGDALNARLRTTGVRLPLGA